MWLYRTQRAINLEDLLFIANRTANAFYLSHCCGNRGLNELLFRHFVNIVYDIARKMIRVDQSHTIIFVDIAILVGYCCVYICTSVDRRHTVHTRMSLDSHYIWYVLVLIAYGPSSA